MICYCILSANKNKVINKGAIAEHLWGDNMDMADSYDFIYTHIKNLRKKLIQAGCQGLCKVGLWHGIQIYQIHESVYALFPHQSAGYCYYFYPGQPGILFPAMVCFH